MFILEYHLIQFQQNSHIYRDLPMALIFYRELIRKDIFKKGFSLEHVRNYFHRFDDDFIEVLFPDSSTLMIKFDKSVCYFYLLRSSYFKEFNI